MASLVLEHSNLLRWNRGQETQSSNLVLALVCDPGAGDDGPQEIRSMNSLRKLFGGKRKNDANRTRSVREPRGSRLEAVHPTENVEKECGGCNRTLVLFVWGFVV